MKAYGLSILVGVAVGVIYGLFKVKSPAPPVVALAGLLAMLAGEQIVQQVKTWRDPTASKAAADTALTGAPAAPHQDGGSQ